LPLCDEVGQCQGVKLFSGKVSNKDDCMVLCRANASCEWFTYFTDFQICMLFKTCDNINIDLKTAISGEKECTSIDNKGNYFL